MAEKSGLTQKSGQTRAQKSRTGTEPAPIEIELPASAVADVTSEASASEPTPIVEPAASEVPASEPVELVSPVPESVTPTNKAPGLVLPAAIGLLAGALGGFGGQMLLPAGKLSPASSTTPQTVALPAGLMERLDKAEAASSQAETREAALRAEISALKTALASESAERKSAQTSQSVGALGLVGTSSAAPAPDLVRQGDLESVKTRLGVMEAAAKTLETNAKSLEASTKTLPEALNALSPKVSAVSERVEALGKNLASLTAREGMAKAASVLAATDYLAASFQAGDALATPLAALKNLGVSPESLVPFAPFAEKGAAKASQIQADLRALIAKEPKSEIKPDASDLMERLKKAASGLVEIRKTSVESPADDAGLLAQAVEALGKADLPRASGTLAKLSTEKASVYLDIRQRIDAQLSASKALPSLKHAALAALAAGTAAAK